MMGSCTDLRGEERRDRSSEEQHGTKDDLAESRGGRGVWGIYAHHSSSRGNPTMKGSLAR